MKQCILFVSNKSEVVTSLLRLWSNLLHHYSTSLDKTSFKRIFSRLQYCVNFNYVSLLDLE